MSAAESRLLALRGVAALAGFEGAVDTFRGVVHLVVGDGAPPTGRPALWVVRGVLTLLLAASLWRPGPWTRPTLALWWPAFAVTTALDFRWALASESVARRPNAAALVWSAYALVIGVSAWVAVWTWRRAGVVRPSPSSAAP